MLIDLPRLLAPLSEAQFLDHFHNKTRLLIRSSDRERAISLLPWQRINELIISDSLDDKHFYLARDSNRLPTPFFRSEKGVTLRPGKLDDLIAQGVSMVIRAIHKHVPAIRLLADDIERRLGCKVYVNTYVSFGCKSAFHAHWDEHDVLVLQVHGRKQWRFAPGPIPYPLGFRRADMGHDRQWEEEIVLEAGDVLYVPRGEIHVAELVDEPSVHLTIGLSPVIGLDYLEHVRKLAEADPLLRMDLLRRLEPSDAAQHEATVKQHLHALIDASSFADFYNEDDLKREPSAYLSLGATALAESSRLAPGLRRRISLPDSPPGSAPVTIVVAEDKHVLPAAAIAILAWLFDHEHSSLAILNDALIPVHGEQAIKEGLALLLRRGLVVDLSAMLGL